AASSRPMPTAAMMASSSAPTAASRRSSQRNAVSENLLPAERDVPVISGQALLDLVRWVRQRADQASEGGSPCPSSATSRRPPARSSGPPLARSTPEPVRSRAEAAGPGVGPHDRGGAAPCPERKGGGR